jgi:hypothetical protein
MARKYDAIDVVKLRATLTLEHWRGVLLTATKKQNTEKLIAWRYGLQAGMSEAAKLGLNDEQLCVWVLKRCKDLEKCMRFILKKRHKNPMDDAKAKQDPNGYVRLALEAKRKRDREFEAFLQRSSY